MRGAAGGVRGAGPGSMPQRLMKMLDLLPHYLARGVSKAVSGSISGQLERDLSSGRSPARTIPPYCPWSSPRNLRPMHSRLLLRFYRRQTIRAAWRVRSRWRRPQLRPAACPSDGRGIGGDGVERGVPALRRALIPAAGLALSGADEGQVAAIRYLRDSFFYGRTPDLNEHAWRKRHGAGPLILAPYRQGANPGMLERLSPVDSSMACWRRLTAELHVKVQRLPAFVQFGRATTRVRPARASSCRTAAAGHSSACRPDAGPGCPGAGVTVLTSNKGFEEWGSVLGDEVMAAADAPDAMDVPEVPDPLKAELHYRDRVGKTHYGAGQPYAMQLADQSRRLFLAYRRQRQTPCLRAEGPLIVSRCSVFLPSSICPGCPGCPTSEAVVTRDKYEFVCVPMHQDH